MKMLRPGCLSLALAAPACCVAAGVRIKTPRGEVQAGTLAVGDRVWSVEVASGRRVEATIVQIRRATRECMALHWRDGVLVCTPDHPVFAPETGDYQPASSWAPGRGLLVAHEEGARPVVVTEVEVFAGVHEVLDIALDREPHNFVAAGVVVHNKSPAPDYLRGEADGPEVALGGGEAERFRVHACLDGADRRLTMTVYTEVRSTVPPDDDVPFEFAVDFEDGGRVESRSGAVPFDEEFTPGSPTTACSEGVVVTLRRADAGTSGEIAATWSVEAAIDRVLDPVADGAVITVTIEPEPEP